MREMFCLVPVFPGYTRSTVGGRPQVAPTKCAEDESACLGTSLAPPPRHRGGGWGERPHPTENGHQHRIGARFRLSEAAKLDSRGRWAARQALGKVADDGELDR